MTMINNLKKPRIFLSPPHMGDEELGLVREAFASNYIAPIGPMVDAFEQEFAAYTGIPHCVALASGTAAMHLALRELGVGPGDEVLASTLTFIGSISPATFLGASIAFIDAEEGTWNMDPDLLAQELADSARRGKLPKAVLPTDLYGQCCDLPRILEVCARHGVPVVSDSAEAMGAFYQVAPSAGLAGPDSGLRHAGHGAKAAVFSFNGNKIMTTSGGGMLASHDPRLIEHARKLSQQARDPAPHYEHTEIGYNYRMSNILSAIGRGQLRVLDERVAAKRRVFDLYQQLLGGLPGLTFISEAPTGRCNRWLTVIRINPAQFGATPEQVRLALEAENIEARPVWKPMHLQPVFRSCRIRGGTVSEHLFQGGLCLPSGTAMTTEDIQRVVDIIRTCPGKSVRP